MGNTKRAMTLADDVGKQHHYGSQTNKHGHASVPTEAFLCPIASAQRFFNFV
jgi:hypothetical protein